MKHSLFAAVPGLLADLDRPCRADLHIHTTASDGEFTPTQVVAAARQEKLAAIAITDHDTLAALDEARAAAAGNIEIVPGVEISAGFNGREIHLLGYFLRPDHGELNQALEQIREGRRKRFDDFLERLGANGVRVPADPVRGVVESTPSLGRRHLATLLVANGHARTRHEAFHRFLGPLTGLVRPKTLLPAEEAINLVRAAGGVVSLAHPSPDLSEVGFRELKAFGLAALEVNYPWGRRSRARNLREITCQLGLQVTGGSDCHGPDPPNRRIGSHGVGLAELTALRNSCAQSLWHASRD